MVAKVAPALRAANLKGVFITNPSFGPLVSSNQDVLTALPHTGDEKLIRRTLENATHMTSWSHLWRCAKAAQPETLSTPATALDHNHSLAAELRNSYRQNGKPLVGICWRTALIGRNVARDSHLNSWTSLLDSKDYDFLSLQYGLQASVRQELAVVKADRGWVIEHDSQIDTIQDLPRYAAQIAACDVVVSIDCSTAYLAAGLGIRTMTLLSTVALETWGTEKTCPFFPNNSIFRQVEPNGWEQPIWQASNEISSIFANNRALIAPRLQARRNQVEGLGFS